MGGVGRGVRIINNVHTDAIGLAPSVTLDAQQRPNENSFFSIANVVLVWFGGKGELLLFLLSYVVM